MATRSKPDDPAQFRRMREASRVDVLRNIDEILSRGGDLVTVSNVLRQAQQVLKEYAP